MAFKPLTKTALKQAPESTANPLAPQSHAEIVASTTERINIIYDDSGSMTTSVDSDGLGNYKTCIELAAEATTDYMKNCKPHVTAVEVSPLCSGSKALTKNLPMLSVEVKAIPADGGSTPLYEALGKLCNKQPTSRFTRALIFTDGSPTDYDNGEVVRAKELKLPIDVIIIGAYTLQNIDYRQRELKNLAEATGGTFMICKDGKAFKEKMKYFAPLLRHMLADVASEGL